MTLVTLRWIASDTTNEKMTNPPKNYQCKIIGNLVRKVAGFGPPDKTRKYIIEHCYVPSMAQKSIDDIFNELASLGINVKWLKEGGISYKAASDLLAGLKALLELKATHRRIFVLP